MKHSLKRTFAAFMAVAISASMLPTAFASAKVEDKGETHDLYATDVKVTQDGEVSYKTACKLHATEEISNKDYEKEANVTVAKVQVAPTCTETGYYYYLVNIYGDDFTGNHETANLTDAEYKATGHAASGQYVYKHSTATCTDDGVADRYEVCATCGELFNKTEVEVGALGHDMKLVGTDSLGNKCYECQRVGCGATNYVPYGHTHVQGQYRYVDGSYKAPTCTENGSYVEEARCTVCGEVVDTKTVTVETKGHRGPVSGTKLISKPTCIAEGSFEELHKCLVCGKDYKVTKTIAKIPHTYQKDIISNTATCEDAGIVTYQMKCSVCGDIQENSKKQEFQAAYNHDKTKTTKENVIEATCVKEGSYEKVVTCERCGKELSRDLVLVKATGKHSYEYKLVWMNADNTILGDKDVITKNSAPRFAYAKVCTVCGRTENVTQWIQATPIPSKTVEPTAVCDTGSKTFTATLTYVDQKTGKTYTETQEKTFAYYPSGVPAAHTWKTTTSVTKEATCTEEGVKTTETKCTVCGTVDESKTVTETIAKIDHNYGEYVETTAPTYTEAGVKTATCSACGDTKTAEIAKLTVTKQKLGYVHNVASKKMQVEFQKFVPAKGYTVKYQIRYATNKGFTKGVKNVYTVKSSKMIKSLTKGKTYYVKVRTHVYDADGNDVARGKYSEVTKITIKK